MSVKRNKKELTLSREWIYNYSINYLSKYSTSSKNLERIIKRKLVKLSKNNVDISPQIDTWIKITIKQLEEKKFLDDIEFSNSKAFSLFRSGKPSKMIYNKLKSLGLSEENIKNAIANVSNNFTDENSYEDLDYKAAIIFAKKRNISIKNLKNISSEQTNKYIRKFNNAGFSLNTIRKLVDLDLNDYQN